LIGNSYWNERPINLGRNAVRVHIRRAISVETQETAIGRRINRQGAFV
jgi:hypothetical protein